MVRAEAEIDVAHLLKTPQQQTGGDEQHQRDSDFTHHQRGAQPRVAAAGRAGASTFLESLIHARPQGGKSRSQSANQAGDHGEDNRERHHLASRGRSR